MKWGIAVMKSKTSFIDLGVLRNDFKTLGWIGAVYLLAMLLCVPLKILMLHSNPESTFINISNGVNVYLRIFQFGSFFQVILMILVPVLAGLLLFRYLQDNKAADMIHAWPVQRVTLYNTHILAGLVLLALPLIITALVSWALMAGLGISGVSAAAVFTWLGVSLLIHLLFFLTSVATGMFTGLSIVQGLLSYILLLLPAGLLSLIMHNLKMYIYGFAYDYYYSTNLDLLSPLVRIFESLSSYTLQTSEIVAYLLISAALYGIGLYLYKRRQLETAGTAITFPILRPLFKYGVTFCFMLLLGSYFRSTQNTAVWTYFGYFLGAGLGYFLTEILFKKSWQVFRFQVVKGFLVYSLIMIGLIGVINADFTGYEKRLPPLTKVESVYLDSSFFLLNESTRPKITGIPSADINMVSQVSSLPVRIYKEADNIAEIHALHQEIINNRNQGKAFESNSSHDYRQERICLVYNLTDGSTISRQYNIKADDYHKNLEAIYETEEYKLFQYPILSLEPAQIKMLEISPADVNKKGVRIVDPQLINQAVAALQADAKRQTYEDMTSLQPFWAHISILLDTPENAEGRRDELRLSWEKSFVIFEQWLIDTEQINSARVLPGDDIEYAVVTRRVVDDHDAGIGAAKQMTRQEIVDLASDPRNLKISASDQLEACLRSYSYINSYVDYRSDDETIYEVFFLLQDGNSFSGGFNENSSPVFVREFFGKQKQASVENRGTTGSANTPQIARAIVPSEE